MKKFSFGIGLLALSSVGFGATLLSTHGTLGSPTVLKQQFTYDPATQGSRITIQTYGYGGSGNAPGGTNAGGFTILPGGFDPIIGLFFGAIGENGARIAFNDDGDCGAGAGAIFAGACYDSRLVLDGLAPGTYVLSLSVFPAVPPATEGGIYDLPNSFGTAPNEQPLTGQFAVDVVSSSPNVVPEPQAFVLMSAGLLGFAALRRFRASR